MKNFIASIAGAAYKRAITDLACARAFRELPRTLWLNDVRDVPSIHWSEKLVSATKSSWARWNHEEDEHYHQLNVYPRSELVSFSIPDAFSTPEEGFEILSPLPFEVGALASVFFHEWIAADHRRWSFSRSHLEHGWGCAFRGAGHDRLVSRRWLEFGPWRVIRRPDDTTFIQFHDLEITDPAEAYEQAKVGHERMGLSSSGGFIQQIEDWMLADVSGIYHPGERLLEVIVAPGISVPQSRMLNACVARFAHRLHPPAESPVDRIAYVFLDLEEAHAHLHELWLRELECWVIDGAGKRRLDHDYHPVPAPPAWVKRLDGR